jgi:hypothetical protein
MLRAMKTLGGVIVIEQVLASSDSASGGGAVVLTIILLIVGFFAYWVPTIVAAVRKVPNVGSVAVINFFLGWTFIGWVVALAMAMRSAPPAVH